MEKCANFPAKSKINLATSRKNDYNFQNYRIFLEFITQLMRSPISAFFKGFAIFLFWAAVGASLYSVATVVNARNELFPSILQALSKSQSPAGPEFENLQLDAEAVSVTSADRPVDLDFDAKGNGFLLDAGGFVYRVKPGGQRDTVPYIILTNEKSESAIRFRAFALHPGFLDSESKGFGLFYTIEPENKNTGVPNFTPQFGNNAEHHQDVIYEYRTLDPQHRLFSGSRRELMRFSQPGPDHNVNDLAFDRLGRLFIATGDGAKSEPGPNTASRNAMALTNPYGKILRIDPLGKNAKNGNYGIPRRNPFSTVENAQPEIWCYGLRDPRWIQFDPFRDWLSIAEAGPGNFEEVNISEHGGEHFGWDFCEGSYFYPPVNGKKPNQGVANPKAEFRQDTGATIAGSMIYRGNHFPSLHGKLVFASQSGQLMAARTDTGTEIIDRIKIANQASLDEGGITGIRPGPEGEILVMTARGGIFGIEKQTTASGPRKPRRPLLCLIAR